MPSSIAPMITSKSECSPRLWPSVLGRPRSLAQRPLPSMTRATWRGRSSGAMAGGRAPPAWGSGGRTGPLTVAPTRGSGMLNVLKRADRMLQVPLQVRGDQTAALYLVPSFRRVGLRPVPAQQRAHQGDRVDGRRRGPGRPAGPAGQGAPPRPQSGGPAPRRVREGGAPAAVPARAARAAAGLVGRPAQGALGQGGRVAGDRERPE